MRRAVIVTALSCAAACAHERATVDTRALVAADGLDGALAELRFRVASDAHDRGAWAALGAVALERDRPGLALDALDHAEALGGPPGDRLPGADRARLAALLAARGGERAARGAPAAVDDLERARRLGATIDPALARRAEIAAALAQLRHADARVRAAGRARLVRLAAAADTGAAPAAGTAAAGTDAAAAAADAAALAGFAPTADLAAQARAGAWLWDRGARRAALEALDAWVAHDGLVAAGALGGDAPAIAERWLAAHAWWGPVDAPTAAQLAAARALGARACSVADAPGDGCDPDEAAADPAPDGPRWEPALWRRAEARGWRSATPAWLVVAARAYLRGDAPDFVAAARAHLDVTAAGPAPPPGATTAAAIALAPPAWARPSVARLRGASPAEQAAALDAALAAAPHEPPGPRLVVALEAALAGRPAAEVAAALGPPADQGAAGAALLADTAERDARAAAAVAAPADAAAAPAAPELAAAAANRALRDAPLAPPGAAAALAAIARAYLRDPALADRAAADWIDGDVDVAARAPLAAALFAALGDPSRARAAWQRAVDASPGEVALVVGLGRAAAAAGDPDAALIWATGGAAASGDAAPTLLAIARAVAATGHHPPALELVKLALQLAAPGDDRDALDLAIAESRAAGLDAQADALAAERRRTSGPPPPPTTWPDPGPDAGAALAAAAAAAPRAAGPRAVLAADPRVAADRRARALVELAAIAADPRAAADDADLAWAAVAAAAAAAPAASHRPAPTAGR